MQGFITRAQLDTQLDFPVGLPLTELTPDRAVVLGAVSLSSAAQTLSVAIVQAHVFTATAGTPSKVVPARGDVYFSIEEDGIPVTGAYVDVTATSATVPVYSALAATVTKVGGSSPKTYVFKAVNNTSNITYGVAVTGQARIQTT